MTVVGVPVGATVAMRVPNFAKKDIRRASSAEVGAVGVVVAVEARAERAVISAAKLMAVGVASVGVSILLTFVGSVGVSLSLTFAASLGVLISLVPSHKIIDVGGIFNTEL